MRSPPIWFVAWTLCFVVSVVDGFNILFMGRRGRGNLQRSLQDNGKKQKEAAKGQEITGVTLPEEASVRGVEFF